MARFQIQRCDFHGDFEDIFRADFVNMNEAIRLAGQWADRDPQCSYGVRVVDTFTDTIVWEN